MLRFVVAIAAAPPDVRTARAIAELRGMKLALSDAPADVTLIVTPRERFGFARESLASIVAHTPRPYELIYVDVGMPRAARVDVERIAAANGFPVIRTPHFVAPNQARNLALARVRTKYVAFVENDVMVSPGWLPPLVACAEEAGAAIVMPLLCQGLPLHTIVHCAGGRCAIETTDAVGAPSRHYVEEIFDQRRTAAEVAPTLTRRPTELVEFHCLLVRADVLARLGPLDEKLRGSREHVDLCLAVRELGLPIMFEPSSCATFADDAPFKLSDLPYYMLRWSDAWERSSLDHLQRKWRFDLDERLRLRWRNIGWRRRAYLVRPIAARLCPGEGRLPQRIVAKGLSILERGLNAVVSYLHRVRVAG